MLKEVEIGRKHVQTSHSEHTNRCVKTWIGQKVIQSDLLLVYYIPLSMTVFTQVGAAAKAVFHW